MAVSAQMSKRARLQRGCAAARVSGRTSRAMRCYAQAVSSSNLKAVDRVKLGDSNLDVSICCLGTMTWGRQNTAKEAFDQLSYAFDLGINFMDTAEMYPVPPSPETRQFTHRYIAPWLATRRREDIVLASKVAGYGGERLAWLREPNEPPRVNAAQIKASVDTSLMELKTDYLDLLQIHWPDRYVALFGAGAFDKSQLRTDDVPIEEQLRGLEDVIKAGKVRYIGVSNETSYGVSEFVRIAKEANLPKIVSIQNCYSLLVRTQYETDLAETCHYHNVGLLAYSPLAGGALTGKYILGGDHPTGRFNNFPGFMDRYNKSQAREAVQEYCNLAQKHGLTPTQLALAWCKSRWFVASTIIGATSMEQLKANILAFNVELSPEVLDGVAALHKKYRDPSMSQ